MAKVAVILSGCGHMDGSEIHEASLCLLELCIQGHQYFCFSLDKMQKKVVNHLTQEEVKGAPRNMLQESARIARGKIAQVKEIKEKDFDALLLPGGLGAALNLCDFAEKSEHCHVDLDVQQVIQGFYFHKKPIGATCIAPVVVAKALEGVAHCKMTLGSDAHYQEILEKMGAQGVLAEVSCCVVDKVNKIFTTPCYMEKTDIAGIYQGIKQLISEMFQ